MGDDRFSDGCLSNEATGWMNNKESLSSGICIQRGFLGVGATVNIRWGIEKSSLG